MLNPLVIAAVKQDPTKMLRPAIAVAVATCAVLVRVGVERVHHDTMAGTMIAHWLCGLMIFAFWIAVIVSALERYTDVVERAPEFGLLRVLGASRSYLLSLLVQETAVFAMPGLLGGIVLAYATSGVLYAVSGGLIAFQIPVLWWPAAAVLACLGGIAGAAAALPRAITDGLKEAL